MTTAGKFTEYKVPTASAVPVGIVAGPDNNLWFTERSANKIGRITTTGTITEFNVPTAASQPYVIKAGPHALWFSEFAAGKLSQITTAGKIAEYPIPGGSGSGPIGLEPNGTSIWAAQYKSDHILDLTL